VNKEALAHWGVVAPKTNRQKNTKYIHEKTNIKKNKYINFQIIIELFYLFTLTQIHSKKYQ